MAGVNKNISGKEVIQIINIFPLASEYLSLLLSFVVGNVEMF